MKIFTLLCTVVLMSFRLFSQQTPVYLNITSHTEDTDPILYDTDSSGYKNHRQLVKQLADVVISKGAKWNCQLEWKYLLGVLRYDKSSQGTTEGKNIVRWMKEHSNGSIDIDPHSHQNGGYNYADVAHLIDSCGIASSKVVGGFPYDDATAGKSWTEFENGMKGIKYKFLPAWKANIIWGGAKKGVSHAADINAIGAWKPKSIAEFMVHDSSKRVTLIGNGAQNIIAETTLVTTNISRLQEFVDAVASGRLPAGKFYSATLMLNFRDLSPELITRVGMVIDSVKRFVDAKTIRWATITEKDSVWRNVYRSEPHFLSDDHITSVAIQYYTGTPDHYTLLQNYPNPFNPSTEITYRLPAAAQVRLTVHDLLGKEVAAVEDGFRNAGTHSVRFNAASLAGGVYFYRLKAGSFTAVRKMLVVK